MNLIHDLYFMIYRMSSLDALSNTLEKSTPSEETIGTNIQTTQEAPQSQPQELQQILQLLMKEQQTLQVVFERGS